jgi:hypothetical protein
LVKRVEVLFEVSPFIVEDEKEAGHLVGSMVSNYFTSSLTGEGA